MICRWLSVLGVLMLGAALYPKQAAAADAAQGQPPSVMSYAFDGFTFGVVVGLSAGYLRARQDGFKHDDWKPFVLGGGIGALSGAALGLTLGFVDLGADRPHSQYIFRDGKYGAGLGLLLGAITGALVMVRSDKPEHIGFGASVGSLCGAGLGLVAGVIEGARAAKSTAEPAPVPGSDQALRPAPALTFVRDASGSLRPVVLLGARF